MFPLVYNVNPYSLVKLVWCFLLLLCSCSLQTDFEYASQKDLLTVNGFLNPDSTISVRITRTAAFPKGDSFAPIPGALVRVFENGILLGVLPYSPERKAYTLEYRPKEGHTYQLEVEAAGHAPISASTRIPLASSIAACATSFPASGVGMMSGRVKTQMRIARADQSDAVWVGFTLRSYQSYPTETPPFREIDSSAVTSRYIWSVYSSSVAADPFNGQKDEGLNEYSLYLRLTPEADLAQYEVDAATLEGPTYQAHQRLPDSLGQYVHVFTASEEFDRYLKNAVLEFINSNVGADIPNPFAELVITYSNVEGGTGVFAGYQANILPVRQLNQCP